MLESNSKLYYSIKEVSEMTELKPYVLNHRFVLIHGSQKLKCKVQRG